MRRGQLKAANDLRFRSKKKPKQRGAVGETGSLRIAAHTVIGGLTGGASGAAGSLAGTITAPLVAEELAKAGITGNLATATPPSPVRRLGVRSVARRGGDGTQ